MPIRKLPPQDEEHVEHGEPKFGDPWFMADNGWYPTNQSLCWNEGAILNAINSKIG